MYQNVFERDSFHEMRDNQTVITEVATKEDVNREKNLTPGAALGASKTFHHHPSTISQMSNYKRELNNYSSVSPSRSAIGLAPLAKDHMDALYDKHVEKE